MFHLIQILHHTIREGVNNKINYLGGIFHQAFINAFLSLRWGGGHNEEKNVIDFFHVSDHLEQFGGLLFFVIFFWKN